MKTDEADYRINSGKLQTHGSTRASTENAVEYGCPDAGAVRTLVEVFKGREEKKAARARNRRAEMRGLGRESIHQGKTEEAIRKDEGVYESTVERLSKRNRLTTFAVRATSA